MEIKQGDIFLCGKHRLMCGDSLKLTDVQKLLEGQKADMIFTDPPYNVNYIPEKRARGGRKVKILGGFVGDKEFNIESFLDLIHTGICKGAVYICHGNEQTGKIIDWIKKHFDYRVIILIWVKQGFSILRGDYNSQYEPIAYFHYPENKWRGTQGQSDIWFFKRRNVMKYVHPTQKPVALVQKAIINSSDEEDIVLDLFVGSGTTLIACENTRRRCYAMEIDPKYVEITIKRWEVLTNQKAIKLNEFKPNI